MKYRLGVLTTAAALLSACIALPEGSDGTVLTVPAPIIIGQSQPDVIIIDKNKIKEDSVHVCTLNAFTSTYKAEDTNRGKAKLNVKRQCLNNFHEMFCKDQDIKCTEYK